MCHEEVLQAAGPWRTAADRWKDHGRQDKFRRQRRRERGEITTVVEVRSDWSRVMTERSARDRQLELRKLYDSCLAPPGHFFYPPSTCPPSVKAKI